MGCEARKLPADAGVFFLDFFLYRTNQELGLLSLRLSHALLYLPVKHPVYFIVGVVVLIASAWLAWAIVRDMGRDGNPAIRQRRILSGWRLWVTVALLMLVFFSAFFSLMNITSSPGSRWDISWPPIALLAVGATLVVWLCTLLSVRMKR
jgi:hypothetical protein